MTSILDGGRRVNDDVSPEAVVADIDLDREFERHLREFREIERLAARKEQEREQVIYPTVIQARLNKHSLFRK